MLEAFKDIVPDISATGTHSLRSGGATAAANAGVPDRLFKRHGRWASESAKDGYVQDSLSSRLSVSKDLEGCPIHPHCNGPFYPCYDPYFRNSATVLDMTEALGI